MSIQQFIPPVLLTIKKRLERKFRKTHSIGDLSFAITSNHLLPEYQRDNKLYDRFLPVLAQFITAGQTIIDVGANIGDTAIMLRSTSQAQLLCVEPSDLYFPLLEKNIAQLPVGRKENIRCVKALVSRNEVKGTLKHINGTATIVEGSDTPNYVVTSLDTLAQDTHNLALIKVDTDGYDYDVLLSGKETLKTQQPILYWENQIDNEDQQKGYEQLYQLLEENNYKYLYIFDNYGNLMVEKASFQTLKSINAYIRSMELYNCTRTMYYTDILGVTEEKHALVEQVIAAYKKEWIYT
ncbi:MAG: FkbM family methyltransferase [Aureispira sp.]